MFHRLAGTAACLKRRSGGTHLPALWQFTDPTRLPDPMAAIDRLPAGAGVVFRHFGMPAYRDLGTAVRALCRDKDIVFLVGADEDLAVTLHADGVHLPERLFHHAPHMRARHPGWVLTVAAHSMATVQAAQGVDAIFASPVFPSISPSAGAPIGIEVLMQWVRVSPCPVFALGGVTTATIDSLMGTGCAGVAGVGF
jgi:thiamine-phosphate pyrophosphorylase